MKLFMTGICGRLGRAVAQAANIAADFEGDQRISIVGLDVAPWPDKLMAKPDCVSVHQGSYADIALVEKLLEGCDGFIHAGGIHGELVDQIPASDFLDAHLTKLLPVLEAAQHAGVSNAVLCSTMEVLVGHTFHGSGATYFTEDSSSVSDTGYSLCRRLMEVLGVEFARRTGMSIASLRFMAFGYDDRSEGQWLLARSLASSDAASAVLAAVKTPYLQGEVFNIGPDTPLGAADIAKALSDPQAVLEHYYPGATKILEDQSKGKSKGQGESQAIESKYYWPVTSIRKAKLMLGWQPQWSFEHWLHERGWQSPHGVRANPNLPAWKSNRF